MKLPKLELNSPVVIWFTVLAFVVLMFGYATSGASTAALFVCRRSRISDPMMWIRMFTYIFGHEDITHFVNNFTAITLLYIENFLPASEVEGTVASASTLSVLVSIISAVALACIATYLIIICLKELKKQRQEREKKAEEKLALETETNNASEEAKSEDDTITVNVSVEEKRKNNVLMIVLFAAGIAYLVVNWISTLIVGFLK